MSQPKHQPSEAPSRALPKGMSEDGHEADRPVTFSYSQDNHPPLKRTLIRAIERASGQRRMKRIYEREIASPMRETENFYDLAIEAL